MSTLRDLLEEHTALGAREIDHLQRLAGDWQLIADLSFADLLLWVHVDPNRHPNRGQEFVCVAQVRPTTGPTAYQDDSVGRTLSGPEAAHLAIADDIEPDRFLQTDSIPNRRVFACAKIVNTDPAFVVLNPRILQSRRTQKASDYIGPCFLEIAHEDFARQSSLGPLAPACPMH